MLKKYFFPCVFFIILCLCIAGLAGWVTETNLNVWFQALNKPFFNPPSWVFGPVWTTLYIMIGIVGGRLWVNRSQHQLLFKVYLLQLVFNFAWSFIFFGLHHIGFALIDLCLLWLSVGTMLIIANKIDRPCFWLLLPYFLWVSFAMSLNFSLWYLN